MALPTVLIFVVVGLWHGAAWTFVLFGLMHGLYLATNEFWRALRRKARRAAPPGPWAMAGYHALTLFAVVMANVMFRAESSGDALLIWSAMLSPFELGTLPEALPAAAAELVAEPFLFILLVAALTAFAPNTQQIMGRYRPVLGWDAWRGVAPAALRLVWRPTLGWAVWSGAVLFLGIVFILRAQSEFIYINF